MKKLFALSIFLTISYSAIAQLPLREREENDTGERFADRLFIGGGLGLQFGTSTYIEIAPIIGYKLTERLSAGLGLKYIYYKLKYSSTQSYSTNIYGGGPFVRFNVIEGLFLHAEYEVLNLEVPDIYYREYVRKNITSVFLGGGYRQMIGNSSSLDLLLLFNVNESMYTPYPNPVIRIGFSFGL